MPSFDIVSELNLQEVDNAVNQATKEVANRFDFKGTQSSLRLDKEGIYLESVDEFKMKALIDILQSKAIKRDISLKALAVGQLEAALGGRIKCLVGLIQGIEQEKARDLVKRIKEMDLKVQAAIEGVKVRVTGKKRDDLQVVIQNLRAVEFPIPLQFVNFRD